MRRGGILVILKEELTDNRKERRIEDESEVLVLIPSGCSLLSWRTSEDLMVRGCGDRSEDVCFSHDKPTTHSLYPHRRADS